MKKRTIPFLMILLILGSCDEITAFFEQEKSDPNTIRTYFENGNLKAQVKIDTDKERHGEALLYYESGKLKSVNIYNHGVKEKATQYFENGNKQMEFFYKDGMKHGKRTKFWENGKVQSVVEYHEDNPKQGLIEYNKAGNKISKYPKLKVQHIDRLDSRGKYFIDIYFSSNSKRGNYYVGKLENGVLNHSLIKLELVDGKGRITYAPPPGTFLMDKLNVIGSYKTAYGNRYIVEKTINVAIDY